MSKQKSLSLVLLMTICSKDMIRYQLRSFCKRYRLITTLTSSRRILLIHCSLIARDKGNRKGIKSQLLMEVLQPTLAKAPRTCLAALLSSKGICLCNNKHRLLLFILQVVGQLVRSTTWVPTACSAPPQMKETYTATET